MRAPPWWSRTSAQGWPSPQWLTVRLPSPDRMRPASHLVVVRSCQSSRWRLCQRAVPANVPTKHGEPSRPALSPLKCTRRGVRIADWADDSGPSPGTAAEPDTLSSAPGRIASRASASSAAMVDRPRWSKCAPVTTYSSARDNSRLTSYQGSPGTAPVADSVHIAWMHAREHDT